MILTCVAAVLRKAIGCQPPLVSQDIGGRAVLGPPGMIPSRPDYDYGWMYALIADSRVFFDIGSNIGVMSAS